MQSVASDLEVEKSNSALGQGAAITKPYGIGQSRAVQEQLGYDSWTS